MALPQVGLEAVIANLGQFQAGAKTITNAYNDINTKASAVESATGTLGSSITGLGSKLLSLGAIAGGAALAGVTALGAGLATFAVVGINKAIDLDAQMATIAATMNTTKDAVGPLKDLILDLALDPKLTVNTTQAADAIQLLAQNGVTMTEIMDGAAASTVALANATGANFSTAADIASGVMKVFNIEAADMETAIDGITGVVNTSKFTIEDFGQAFAAAGGIAAEIGVTFEDFSAVIAGTATSFNSGSDAGTSFKTFLQRLANPTNENRDLMEAYGISLFDSAGSMRDMRDVVGQLHGVFGDLTQAQKAELAAQLGGADAARTVLALAGMSVEEFDKLSGSVNDSGQAFRAAATRVDSVKGAFEIFRGIIEAVQIQVGDKFLPLLRSITVGFTDLASKSAPMVVAFFGNISDLISGLILRVTDLFDVFGEKGLAGVFASLGFGGSALFLKTLEELTTMMGLTGTNAASLGETISTTLSAALSFVAENLFPMLTDGLQFIMLHFEEFKGALMGIGAVLGAGVFAALIAGIMGLVSPIGLVIAAAALLGAAWAGNWGGIQEKTFAVWAIVQPILAQLIDWLSVNIPIALQALAVAWDTILLPAIIATWEFVSGTLFPLWVELQTFLATTLFAAIAMVADQWTTILIPALTAVWSFINTKLMPLWVSIINFFGAVGKKGLEAWAGLWKNLLLPALNSVWQFVSANVLPIFADIGETVDTKVGPPMNKLANDILPALTEGLTTVVKWIKDATGFFNSLASAVKNFQLPDVLTPGSPPPMALALQDIASSASMASNAMGNFSQATLDSLLGVSRGMDSVNNAIGMARDTVEKALERTISDDKVKRALKIMGQIFRDNSDAILNATNRVVKFKELLGSVNFGVNSDQQRDIMNSVGIWLSEFDKNITALKAAQRAVFIEAGRTALTIGSKLNDIVGSSVDILDTRVKDLQEFIASGQEPQMFQGEWMNQWLAQIRLNEALEEQREIQDDILQLKQNEQKLTFLEKQLSLVETLNEAGLDVGAILGDINLGLNASIPDMIAATNKLVMAMIEQVNKDLQLGSPSKVMIEKGEQTGMGFVEGILGSIPSITGAMKKAIFGPSVSGPALGGSSSSRVVNNNFNMNVNSGASPQGVMQQFEVARAMVG